jgi:hypothetical protein
MSDKYDVGYKKPPRQHQFKPGNQAARRRGRSKKQEQTFSLAEILVKALRTKRKIKRGNEIITMEAGDIMCERLVQMMTAGTARDMLSIVALIQQHSPQMLAGAPETLEIVHHRAEGSSVPLPPADLWETKP